MALKTQTRYHHSPSFQEHCHGSETQLTSSPRILTEYLGFPGRLGGCVNAQLAQ